MLFLLFYFLTWRTFLKYFCFLDISRSNENGWRMFLFSCRDGHANNRQVMLFLEVAVHSYFTVLMFGKHWKTYGKTFMVKFVCNKAASYSPTTLLRANSNTGALLFRTFSVIFGTAFLKNTYLVSIFTFVDST